MARGFARARPAGAAQRHGVSLGMAAWPSWAEGPTVRPLLSRAGTERPPRAKSRADARRTQVWLLACGGESPVSSACRARSRKWPPRAGRAVPGRSCPLLPSGRRADLSRLRRQAPPIEAGGVRFPGHPAGRAALAAAGGTRVGGQGASCRARATCPQRRPPTRAKTAEPAVAREPAGGADGAVRSGGSCPIALARHSTIASARASARV